MNRINFIKIEVSGDPRGDDFGTTNAVKHPLNLRKMPKHCHMCIHRKNNKNCMGCKPR